MQAFDADWAEEGVVGMELREHFAASVGACTELVWVLCLQATEDVDLLERVGD